MNIGRLPLNAGLRIGSAGNVRARAGSALVASVGAAVLMACGATEAGGPDGPGGSGASAGAGAQAPDAAGATDAIASDNAAPESGDGFGGSAGGGEGGAAGAAAGGAAGSSAGGSAGGAEAGAAGAPVVGLPYPERDAYHIKGVMPDFWKDRKELVTHQIGSVSVNLVWASWEGSVHAPPCSSTEQAYDGHCFKIDAQSDEEIRAYSELGVAVAGIVYGVPSWARKGNQGCSPAQAGFDIFCSPDNPADYARFAGMLAHRYDGQKGHGRIADFVIHNEVNTNIWYDIGCGQGVPCDQEAWIQTYANDYAAAYDAIKAHQSEAKVLISFEHHFDTEFDLPAADFTMISVKTFLRGLDKRLGSRQWQVAYHPYPPDLMQTAFSALDLPRVTYGNIGVLLGWLRAEFPTKPHAWQVQLTESGFNSASPSSEAAQAAATCSGLRNILATPGISNYIYHRMKDHPADGPWKVGMRRSDGSAKPSWSVWASANRIDLSPPSLSCGFEHLPYTRLTLSEKNDTLKSHWTSSRLPPPGFTPKSSWNLLREPAADTVLLFECYVDTWAGDTTFLSADAACGGKTNLGPVGYAWSSQVAGTVPLRGCRTNLTQDCFVVEGSSCGAATELGLLGYARPAK